MTQALSTKIRGLYTFPNDFSSIPEGALSVADNVVIDRDSIAEPRRGFAYLAKTAGRADYGNAADRAVKIFFYDDTVIVQLKNGSTYSLDYFDTTTGWNVLSASFNPPSSVVKTRGVIAKKNLYLTSNDGVYRVASKSTAPKRAGVPQALDIQLVSNASKTPTWLSNNSRVAYRVLLGFKDLHGNLYYGAPSGRYVHTNTSGAAKSTTFYVDFPPGLSTSHFYQIYRSKIVASTIQPNDELQLVVEKQITSAMISAEQDLVEDITPEDMRGVFLYTNDSQETLELSNNIPPKSMDIAWFKDYMFYGNVEYQQSFFLTVHSVADFVTESYPSTEPSSITIAGVKFWAITGDTPNAWWSDPHFFVFKGESSESINVYLTAMSLCYRINYYLTSHYASYISGYNDDPGKIVIKSFDGGAATFYLISSVSTPWLPPLPVSGTTQASTSDAAINGIACSKYLQPEAVPVPYFWPAGSSDYAILRIIPLRDSLYILKEDGVYRLFGTDPTNWQIVLLDSTANIIAPDSATVLNNMIFALTTQGVVTISETGVTIMSRPIEGDILNLLQINPNILAIESFAVAYESQRAYYVWLPTEDTDTYPTQYYRYNTITNNWTRGTLAQHCGGVNPADDRMYLGLTDQAFMYVENKNHVAMDYSDYVSTNAISSVSNKTVTIASASSLEPGQVIFQEPAFAVKTASTSTDFDAGTDVITVNSHGFLTGAKLAIAINSGSLPAGLVAGNYWVIKLSANTFALASTYALAIAGTKAGFTDTGTAAKTVTFTPANSEIWGTIDEIIGSSAVTTTYPCQFIVGDAAILDPIDVKMKWVPATFANPGINKQVREATIMFLSDFYGEASVTFETDISPTELAETILGSSPAPWGRFPWGAAPWGGGVPRRRPVRVMVPRIHQRASFLILGFEHKVCFSPWAIQGVSYIGNNVSEKVWHQGNAV